MPSGPNGNTVAATAPLVVEVWRGDCVESRHRVHAAVCDAAGAVRAAWGDAGWVSYLRSSAKPLQAFALASSGAVEALGLSDRQIAVACASHGAEPFHVEAVRSLLARAGLEEGVLRCGAHRPGHLPEADALVRAGREPSPIHNNCSGKHAGMVVLARYLGAPVETYLEREHPVQRRILAGVSRLTGVPEERIALGSDGCGAPIFALPVAGAATAFARLAAARTGLEEGDRAARRIARAMMAHPELVAGTGRFDTALMHALPQALFCKSGAEGYFCVGLPERGLGVALKAEDGSARPSAPATLHVLGCLGVLPDPLPPDLEAWARPAVTNTRGEVAGIVRVGEG